MSKPVTLGPSVVALIESLGFTHKTLAAATGLSDKTISDWKKKNQVPRRASLDKVMQATPLTMDMIQAQMALFDHVRSASASAGQTATPALHPGAEDARRLSARTYEDLKHELGEIEVRRLQVTIEIQRRITEGDLR